VAEQVEAPSGEKVPLAQLVQVVTDVAPAVLENVPARHFVHPQCQHMVFAINLHAYFYLIPHLVRIFGQIRDHFATRMCQ
jgi:hypothetical protein